MSWIHDEMFPAGAKSASERAAVAVAEELQGRRGFRQNRFDNYEEGELQALGISLVAAINLGDSPLWLAALVDPETAGNMRADDSAELIATLEEILRRAT